MDSRQGEEGKEFWRWQKAIMEPRAVFTESRLRQLTRLCSMHKETEGTGRENSGLYG